MARDWGRAVRRWLTVTGGATALLALAVAIGLWASGLPPVAPRPNPDAASPGTIGGTTAEGTHSGAAGPSPRPAGAGHQPEARSRALAAAIAARLAEAGGVWGVHVEDLATGGTATHFPDRHFAAASTLKLPLAMMVLEQAGRGALNLQETLLHRDEHYEAGTGILKLHTPGERYPVEQLARWSIVYSDNIATRMLLERLGRPNLYTYLRQLGANPQDQEGLTYLRPRDLARCLRELYTGGRLQPQSRQKLLDWLQEAVEIFPGRIRAGVPPAIPVAHKIGTLPGFVHDAGLILAPGHPLVVVVMSSGVAEPEAEKAIADVATLAYRHFVEATHSTAGP